MIKITDSNGMASYLAAAAATPAPGSANAPAGNVGNAGRVADDALKTTPNQPQSQAQQAQVAIKSESRLPAVFGRLLKAKSTKVLADDGRGRVLYEVKVTPEFRNANFVNGRLPSHTGLELRRKEDVTGNPGDSGWVLIDNRKQIADRDAAFKPQSQPGVQANSPQAANADATMGAAPTRH